MSFSEIVNLLLYAVSGFCFGIFASRYSVLCAVHIAQKWCSSGAGGLCSCLPQLLFLCVSFFGFPVWFISRTQTGGFVYYAVLVFFFSRSYRQYVKNR